MEATGKIMSISRDMDTGDIIVTMSLRKALAGELQKLKDLDIITVILKKFRKKRSLDANAYYWQLTTELSEVLGISKYRCHNINLRKYGQLEYVDGKIAYMFVPDTDSAFDQALESQTYHIGPTAQVIPGNNGFMYRTYMMIKGSSEYDTREMSKLIDGIVGDCREMGIETLPPDELERMKAGWKA